MAICVNTLVPSPNGWFKACELKKGDLVFDRDGMAQPIASTHLYTPAKMYRLWYSDGTHIEADPHQRIETITEAKRYKHFKTNQNRQRAQRSNTVIDFTTVQKLFDGPLRDKRDRLNLSTKTCAPVNYYTEDHPVPPFIVGWWFTTRTLGQKNLLIDHRLKQYFRKEFEKLRWKTIQKKNGKINIPQSIDTTMLVRYPTIPNIMPAHYMFGSVEQRISLLRGIMMNYPDSYKPELDRFMLRTKRKSFAKVICGLLESLGIRPMATPKKSDIRIVFATDIPLIPWQENTKPKTAYQYRLIAEVHDIQPRPCIHIETERPMLISAAYISTWH